jgi:hypothetical protein
MYLQDSNSVTSAKEKNADPEKNNNSSLDGLPLAGMFVETASPERLLQKHSAGR